MLKKRILRVIEDCKIKIFKRTYSWFLGRLINEDFNKNNYIQIENENQALNHFKKHIDYFIKIKDEYNYKTEQNLKNIHRYNIIKYYKGFKYIDINRFLRGEQLENNSEYNLNKIKISIDVITKELKNFRLPFNVIVLRRVSNRFFNKTLLKGCKYKDGIEFTDKGFLSTSLNTNINYLDTERHDYNSGKSLMILKVPKGISALYIEPVDDKGELELLLERGLKMKIVKRIIVFSRRIYLIEILVTGKKKPNL